MLLIKLTKKKPIPQSKKLLMKRTSGSWYRKVNKVKNEKSAIITYDSKIIALFIIISVMQDPANNKKVIFDFKDVPNSSLLGRKIYNKSRNSCTHVDVSKLKFI